MEALRPVTILTLVVICIVAALLAAAIGGPGI